MQIIGDHPDIERIERTGYGYEEEEVVYECFGCGREIYEGDYYYEIDGEVYCKECLDDIFGRLA